METTTTQFFEAIKKGDRPIIEKLLADEMSLINARDESGLSPVMTALYYQEPALARLFIELGAKLDLFEASAAGQEQRVVELLRVNPAQVNAFAPDGFQALGLAAFFGRVEVVKRLLEAGADPNIPSRNGLKVQPLNSAVAGQNLEIARLLLASGADPNARQGEDFAPLHGAAQNGQVEMVNLLLAHGADPRAAAANGKTPLDYAKDGGHGPAANALQKALA